MNSLVRAARHALYRVLKPVVNVIRPVVTEIVVMASRRFGDRQCALYFLNAALEVGSSERWATAIPYARAAVASDATCTQAQRVLGYAYFRAGNLAKARETLERGLNLPKREGAFYRCLGDIEVDRRRLGEAVQLYRQALALESGDLSLQLQLGRVLNAQDRLDEARAVLEAARARAPADPAVAGELGFVLSRRGDYPGALPLLRGSVEAEPTDAANQFHLAYALGATGELDQAINHAEAAVRLASDNADYASALRLFRKERTLRGRGYRLTVVPTIREAGIAYRLVLSPPKTLDQPQ